MAIVGCGGMADAHRRALETLWHAGYRTFTVVATCDVNRERADEMATHIAEFQERRPAAYTDLDDMLASESSLVAVDICTPHREHHTLAIACMEAGKHVTIEKPLAITLRAGRLMLDAAQRHNRILHVAENYRRAPAQRAIKWALEHGRIGKPRMFFWVDTFERVWYWGWREHKEIAGGGWTLDGGVHFADLMRYHIGEVDEVYAISHAFFPIRYRKPETRDEPIQVTVEDTTMALLRFHNGVLGQWTLSNAAPGKGYNMRIIYGEHGSIDWQDGLQTHAEHKTVDELVEEFMSSISDDEREQLFPYGITDTVALEMMEFINAIMHGTPIETDGWEGYRSQAICMAVYESAWLNAPVKVEQVAAGELEGYQAQINRELGL